MALTTKVAEVEKALSTTKQSSGPKKPSQPSSRIKNWCKVKTTDSVENNRLIWW